MLCTRSPIKSCSQSCQGMSLSPPPFGVKGLVIFPADVLARFPWVQLLAFWTGIGPGADNTGAFLVRPYVLFLQALLAR